MKKLSKNAQHLACKKLPAFEQPLHVGRPNVGDRECFLERVKDMLDRRWLTNNGPLVQEFERRIAEYTGVKHCILVCNATIGLEIAIRAAGMNGEVIVPSYTFVATAHALQWQGITPVFADIDPRTHSLDPNQIERHITPRTTGIIGTHVWGNPCAVSALEEIAERRKLILMFDAAHAFGCSHQGKMIGSFGLAEVFSFHATKFLNAFEGGAVTTNDDELAKRIRLMKNFGFSGYDNVIYVGTNGKMPEICAAMGLTNLDRIDDLIETNRRNYEAYRQHLSSIQGLQLYAYNENERCNFQYVVVEVDENELGLNRDELVEALHAENILARKYFWPGCHKMEPYCSHFPHSGLLLPQTEHLAAKVIVLPTGTSVTTSDISLIAQVLHRISTDCKKSSAQVLN
jgi:dTDP-4-amino-4,6-dideoxygalactose transaminase